MSCSSAAARRRSRGCGRSRAASSAPPRRWTRRRSGSWPRRRASTRASLLTQFGAYGDPGRDPRMNVVTVAYLAVLAMSARCRGGTDAAAAALLPVSDVLNGKIELAFDHLRIVRDAIERVRVELEVTGIATAFVGPTFTLAELRAGVRGRLGRPARRREFPAEYRRGGRLGHPDRAPSAARLDRRQARGALPGRASLEARRPDPSACNETRGT